MFYVARFKFIASVAVLNGVAALRIKRGCPDDPTLTCCTDWKDNSPYHPNPYLECCTAHKSTNPNWKSNPFLQPAWFDNHCQVCTTRTQDKPHVGQNCIEPSFVAPSKHSTLWYVDCRTHLVLRCANNGRCPDIQNPLQSEMMDAVAIGTSPLLHLCGSYS